MCASCQRPSPLLASNVHAVGQAPFSGDNGGTVIEDRQLVLENGVVFGSVNANRRHYEAAVEALRRSDKGWLEGLITRRVRLSDLGHAFERQRDDVKVVIDLSQ
jgi:hypothetical protein